MHSGGVSMYIKETLTFVTKRNVDCDLPLMEETWTDLETNFRPITIGVIYRHPVCYFHVENFSH